MTLKKFGKFILIFILSLSWIFSGWPQIFNFPTRIQMAQADTATKTWSFVSDAESWSATNPSPTQTTPQWQSADGSPANGSLEMRITGKNKSNSGRIWEIAGTWEAIFGIPAGSTVTEVGSGTGNSYNYRVSEYNVGAAGNSGPFEFYDNTPSLQGTFSAATAFSGLVAWTAKTGAAVSVPAGLQASNNTVRFRITNDLATGNNNGAAVTLRQDQVVLTITYTLPPTFEQSAYHFFNNANSTDVGSELTANQDTPVTLGATGDAFRLRMLLHIATSQLNQSGQNFKLQFAEKSGTCDTGFSGEIYADVTGATAIAYSAANTPADGDNLTANAEDPTHSGHTIVNQDYEEANNFTNTVAAIPSGQDGKWDFSLIDNGAPADTSYCFRIVTSSGGLLTANGGSYVVVPQVTMASGSVPPTLTFSVSDNDIFFGTLSVTASQWADNTADGSTTATVAHTISASTNATNGYTITVKGATLTSTGTPGDTITAMGTEATLTTGQEEFGLRITAAGGNGAVNTDYDNTPANSYFYGANATTTDVIAADADGDDISTTYSLYYAANIATTTEAHPDYTANLIYVATGNF